MTLSYGGNLSFIHYFEGSVNHPLVENPIVVMVGNGFRIEYGPTALEPMNPLDVDVPLHESFWSVPNQPGPIDRRLMMVVLQNVEAIFVRAVQDGLILNAELSSIILHKAVLPGPNVTSTKIARGVEMCDCPSRYSGESCQNPGEGYHRVIPDDKNIDFSTPETVIGYVKRCRCFGHSDVCDPESGVCQDCQHNTKGDSCDLCSDGYFGVATRGTSDDCKPCACPLPLPSNNFSPLCVQGRNGIICTACEEGYTGSKCESCSPGYFGNPLTLNDTCKPCHCNRDGSQSNLCNQTTGQCPCVRGISGRTCDDCSAINFAVQSGECVSCYAGCTGILLNDLANLTLPSKLINASAVAYPWDILFDFEKQAKELQRKLDAAEKAGVAGLQGFKNEAERYKLIADKGIQNAEETKKQAEKLREGATTVLDNATSFENEAKETLDDIKALIGELNDLIAKLLFNESAIDMDSALKKAQEILAVIEGRNFDDAYNATRMKNKLAEMLSDTIKDMEGKNINTTGVRRMVDDLNYRLRDILNETREANETAEIALDKIKELRDLLARVKSIWDEITKINGDTRDMLLEEARKILQGAEDNFLTSKGKSGFINFGLSELKKKVMDLMGAYPKLMELTRQTIEHAINLTNQASDLDKLFANTRDLSEKAVQAANAYKSIVNAIKEAEESANNAKKAAQESTDLAGVSDLEDEVNKLINKSQAQLVQAMKLRDQTKGLRRSTTAIESDLASASNQHDTVKELLEQLRMKLSQAVPADLPDRLNQINETAEEANRMAKEAVELAKKFNSTLETKLESMQKFNIKDFNYDISTDIKQAEEESKKVEELIAHEKQVESNVNAALRKISDITYDLNRLKEKIRDARTRVNNMKLSLQADGQCHRSYHSPLTSSATNEIRLSFRLNTTTSDMLLLLVQQSPQEFLAAEVRNQNVRFSWNSGKGQGSVTHPQTIEAEKWFQLVAKRIGAVGQLKVWNLKEATEKNIQAEVAQTGAGCSLMNLNENSTILLAGSSDLYPIPLSVTRNNFMGCMGDVILDSNPIGAYNFKTNEDDVHCGTCDEVPTVSAYSQVYRFTGYGFAVFVVEGYDNKRTRVELQFKTFYEDSMLFFVGNPALGDFLSIELKDGKVAVAFSMGGLSSTSGSTNNTYNNNKWTNVVFDRYRLIGVMKVGEELVEMTAPGKNKGLELQGSPMFFGGLPTQFDLDKFKKYIKDQPPYFYGCMKNFKFGYSSPDDDTSTLVNVETGSGCRENGVHTVDFYGDGYLILTSDKIEFAEQKNDISLTFITAKGDGVLLIARDIPGENYYSISLVKGTVEARLKSDGTPPITIKSTETFNDGKVHCISLLKNGRTTEVTVDDVQIGTAESRDISFNSVGDLYLGGSPVDTGDITPTNEKLDGCINDVIANGVLLSMSDAKQYKRADVGRCRFTNNYPPASLTSTSENGDIVSDSPASVVSPLCATAGKIDIQDDAVSVGDEGNFFVKLPRVSREDKYTSFSISFEFRTFYANGLFGHLHNPDTGFYFGIQLVDGKLQVKYIQKRKPLEINFSKLLNDGRWHSVVLEKKDSKVNVSHDSEIVQSRSIRRRMSEKMQLIFGGPPKAELFTKSNVELAPHSIRGCVRGLEINRKSFNLTNAQVSADKQQCYKKVQAGAFFGGDAWATIDDDFTITPNFSINMEFRTTRQEAILASVSSQRGDSGFTLELHKGKMEFTLVLNSRIHRVVSNSAKFDTYCDDEWHKVGVTLTVRTISLMMDKNKAVTMDIHSGIRSARTRSSFFIGGYQDGFHQGASISMKRFRGCLRNVQISGKKLDWYNSLISFANIKRTGCPVT